MFLRKGLSRAMCVYGLLTS